MFASEDIKSLALGLGADRCGIASAERFDDAPTGFHPIDVYRHCKSVVAFLKQMPPKAINAENPVVCTHTAHFLYDALDKIGLNFCYALEEWDIKAVPVPTDVPYPHWDAENKHGMGIISMRHAAYNAGLGILGRNTLLINRERGNHKNNPTEVFRGTYWEVTLVQSLLENAEINAYVYYGGHGTTAPWDSKGCFPLNRIMVASEDYERAKEVVDQFYESRKKQEPPDITENEEQRN